MISTRQEVTLAEEMIQLQLSIELIELGARIQMLEAETDLSRNRLIKLYKQIKGESPPKGQLPFSADWYMTWLPNIHSSLFYSIYRSIESRSPERTRIEHLAKAYRLYKEQISIENHEPVLGLTRAWTLLRFIDTEMVGTLRCTQCSGVFLSHPNNPASRYVCGLCQPPSRAGKKTSKV